MRIKDIDGETMARSITRCEREITEMWQPCVMLMACRYFRVKLEV